MLALLALGHRAKQSGADDVPDLQKTLQSARQGNAAAQFNLGLMYVKGQGGVRQDYAEAVKWVKTHYPQTRQPELLEAFVESVRFLSEREQQKAIDLADSWLQEQPDNAPLLMYLGQLAYGRKLWGKAQGYLEASIALQPSVSAHLVLARVFDETDQPQKAQEQRNLVLESVAEEEHPAALPQPN